MIELDNEVHTSLFFLVLSVPKSKLMRPNGPWHHSGWQLYLHHLSWAVASWETIITNQGETTDINIRRTQSPSFAEFIILRLVQEPRELTLSTRSKFSKWHYWLLGPVFYTALHYVYPGGHLPQLLALTCHRGGWRGHRGRRCPPAYPNLPKVHCGGEPGDLHIGGEAKRLSRSDYMNRTVQVTQTLCWEWLMFKYFLFQRFKMR